MTSSAHISYTTGHAAGWLTAPRNSLRSFAGEIVGQFTDTKRRTPGTVGTDAPSQ